MFDSRKEPILFWPQKIVHTVELAGGVMEELAKSGGPRTEVVAVQCQEFMQAVKVRLLIRRHTKTLQAELQGQFFNRVVDCTLWIIRCIQLLRT